MSVKKKGRMTDIPSKIGDLLDVVKVTLTSRLPSNHVPRLGNRSSSLICDASHVFVQPIYLDSDRAIFCFNAEEWLTFISKVPHTIPSQVDAASDSVPSVGQRTPTKTRLKNIKNGWKNPHIINDHAIEVFTCQAFGCHVVSHRGKRMVRFAVSDDQSGLRLNDGGGRAQSGYSLLEDMRNSQEPLSSLSVVQRNLCFLYVVDFNATVQRGLSTFRKINERIKKINSATELAVKISALRESGRIPVLLDPDGEFVAYIIMQIYDQPKENSLVKFLPWKTEGEECNLHEAGFIKIKGSSSSFTTLYVALSPKTGFNMLPLFEAIGSPQECVDAVDFILRQWHRMCPKSLRDRQAGNKNIRMLHQLGMKILFVVSLKAYMVSGDNPEDFETTVTDILTSHYKDHTKDYVITKGPKPRKMTPDRFWFLHKILSHEKFVSSAINEDICTEMIRSANRVIGLDEDDSVAPKLRR